MKTHRNLLRRIGMLVFATTLAALLALPGSPIPARSAPAAPRLDQAEDAALVRLRLPNRAALETLIASGVDLTEYVRETRAGIEVDVVATPAELADLQQRGFVVTQTVFTRADWEARQAERASALAREAALAATTDTITIQQAYFFENYSGTFLWVQASTSAGAAPGLVITASWDAGPGTEPGSGGSANLAAVVDVGVYMYHAIQVPVSARPAQVVVTSSLGGSATADVTEWVGADPPAHTNPLYVKDFVNHYMNPTEVYARIEALAAEFPDLAEIIELPYLTNGYRRKAQAIVGTATDTSRAVVVTSLAWGHEGGNNVVVELKNPGAPGQALGVQVSGSTITVNLATNASGAVVSTAAQVVAALNANAAGLVTSHTYRGNAGAGVVSPWPATHLTDGLSAPPEISREPFQVRAIRIGKHRDGRRLGVLGYAQEHAREWVTPLVTLETAERLLRNYAHDPKTHTLLNSLDIFIIPSMNPDGGHFSFFDYNFQRRNMVNYCGPTAGDPGRRFSWGVDINRNYRVGSLFDGYFGASTNCLSDTFAGPGELSESEGKNLTWLVEQYPHIKFAMNIHSYGGYFMWSPGAYKVPGRISLPRPTPQEEAYYFASSRKILQAIKEHRGTVIFPGQTGPVVDVLYSAAGNSADQLWYERGIFGWDFEVGADIWDPATQEWDAVGFQPPFAEGHEEAMEFANGLIALFEVAREYSKDRVRPASGARQ